MRRFAAPLLLFLVCIGFYWKLALTNDYTFLDSPDLANLDLPRLQFQASSWRHSALPLWDPYQWAGQPFLGQVTGAAYPANWLLGFFPFREGKLSVTVVHWYFVLLHVQAAIFCYLLCRDWKRSRTASVLGGLVFALGGFLGNTDWPQILNGVLWLPLIVLFLVRALRGRRPLFSAAMSGAFLGVAWLSGHHEVPIYASAAFAGIWVTAFCTSPNKARIGALALAFGLTAALIGALQLVPAREYAPLAKRWAGAEDPIAWNEAIPYSVHRHYSWQPSALLGIVTPRTPIHVDPFIGITAFSLALLGVFHGWRRLPHVRVLVFLAFAGLLFALASSNFLHGLFYAALPLFGKARVPARAIALFSFAISPLVAYGFDALGRRSSLWLRRTVWVLAGVGLVLYAAAAAGVRPLQSAEQPMLTAWVALLAAVLLAAWQSHVLPRRLLLLALPLLVVIEIGNVSAVGLASRTAKTRAGHLDRLFHHNDIASYLRAQPQPLRVEASDTDIPYNFGDWHALPTIGGFTASATANTLQLERQKPRIQDLLGVSYYLGTAPPRPDLVPLMKSASGLTIYRNPAALPRAWAVHRATQLPSISDMRLRLDTPTFQPSQEALFLSPAPALDSCSEAEPVRFLNPRSPNRVTLEVTMACRGLVVLSDTDFPGWTATIDGRQVDILQPFGSFRGVVVDKGSHRIEFVYLPPSAIFGAALSATGCLFVFWTFLSKRKPKNR